VGYVDGKAVAKDVVVLNSLPQSPKFDQLYIDNQFLLKAQNNYHYLYRLNCGGSDYRDEYGQLWLADQPLKTDVKHYGSSSWTGAFDGVPAFFASQRRTFSPINGTKDWKLFQSFRYGRDQLKFSFPIKTEGEYLIELYFVEPWLGVGGGLNAEKMRLFDVAINGEVVLKDLDIWKSAGANTALKKTIKVKAKAGDLVISFPNIKSGQAVISAIAVASLDKNLQVGDQRNAIVSLAPDAKVKAKTWLDLGDQQYQDNDARFNSIPSNLYGAEWLQPLKSAKQGVSFKVNVEADVFVGLNSTNKGLPGFEDSKTKITNDKGEQFLVYRKRVKATEEFNLNFSPPVVVVVPPSNLAPAYDLKTITSYKAVEAKLMGQHIGKKVLMGKERVVFNQPAGDAIQFEMSVGVADTYSLTLKYHNPSSATQKLKMEFYSIDGTLMRTEDLELAPTKEGKWNYLNTSTGSMVNAGKYLVKFMAINANNLAIDALDVQ
jgi:hypothetical protein